MKRILLILAMFVTPAIAQVTLTTAAPPYGYLLEPGAVRQPVFYPSTGLVNYSTTGGATLSCTTNCIGTVSWTMPATGGTCSVSGSVGSYVVNSTVNAVLTATSVADPTKTATQKANVCDTVTGSFVDIEPSYQQAYGGQQKSLQSYVIGNTDQSGTWSITIQPGGGDGSLTDTPNRDTLFSATVTGRYTLTYTSAHGPTGTAIVYVAPTLFSSLGYTVTPNKTIPTPCVKDPALTGTDYEVGAGQSFPDLTTVPFNTWTAGSIVRIHSGTYANAILVRGTGTPTQPLIICGIADASGNLPVIDGFNATENAIDAGTSTNGVGAIKMTGTASGFSQGYELGSVGPDYLTITGIKITRFNSPYSYFPAGSSTLTPYTTPSGIWVATSQHLHIEGVELNDVETGMLQLSNTGGVGSNNGRRFTAFAQVLGSHIDNFSTPNSAGTHGLYMQGLYSIVEGTLFDNPQYNISNPLLPVYEGGMFIKMRGGNAIVRYNMFRGITSGVGMQFDEMEDTVAYMDVAAQLGQPGVTNCALSTWCTMTSNNITLPHLAENMQALAKDYYYGNVMSNEGGKAAQPYIQYGSYSSTQECTNAGVYCTPGIDRSGQGYFWANTFDQAAHVFSTANYNTSGFTAVAQNVQPTLFIANTAWWNDIATCAAGRCFPSTWNVDAGAIPTFQTNMAAAGALASSGTITGGTSAGWGGYNNFFTYPLFNPANTHVTGLSAPNFLTSASIPYNRTTFAPVVSSPLISSGSQVTLAEIAGMPVRFQPLNSGYMVPRTDTASATPTIGAVQTGALPTFTAALSPSPGTLAIPSAAIGSQEFIFGTANFSDGTSSFIQYRAQPWASTSGSSVSCFGDNNPACNIIANGTGNITVGFAGLPLSVCFIVGSGGGCSTPTVAAPTFSPVAGTYPSTQSVTISTVTAGASVVYTTNGTTPTVTALSCTITNGTLYTSPVTVSTAQTINAIGCKSGSAASGVSSAAYIIGTAVADPTFTPPAGTYSGTQSIVIATSTGGATICYTMDGTTPTASSGSCTHGTTYSGAVAVSSNLTMKAIGTISGGLNSNVVSAAYTINSTFNVNNGMSETTIQSTINTAGGSTGNTVVFAAGNYTGWTTHLVLPCTNGTVYTGPINSAGVTFSSNQAVKQTSASPAVLNSDNVLANDTILAVNGGSGASAGLGCTIQYLTGFGEELIFTGGIPNVTNTATSGVLIQNNTISGLTSESNPGGTAIFLNQGTSNTTVRLNWIGPNCADTINGFVVGPSCGGISVASATTNVLVDSNVIDTTEEGMGNADSTTGSLNTTISNNLLRHVHRIAIEMTNGNSPGVVDGLMIQNNGYIDPYNPWALTFGLSMACCNFGSPTTGHSWQSLNNVWAANNPSFTGHYGYGIEFSGGKSAMVNGDLVQGFWPGAATPSTGLALENTTTPSILNVTAQGSLMSPSNFFGCEASGTFSTSCNGVTNPVTFSGAVTGATSIQQTTPAVTITPASGTFASPPTVTVTANGPNETIFCTTNGSTPTTASAIYTGPFTAPALPSTVKCIAQWGTGALQAYAWPAGYGYGPSSATANSFTPTAAPPTFSSIGRRTFKGGIVTK